jgi:Ca2+-transporting ATPase
VTSDPADATAGLTAAEVAQRLRRDGFNELPSGDRRRLWIIATDVLREPMFALLLGCGAIYLLLGDLQESLILLGFVVLVAIITVYQEQKTERALEALRDLSSPRALVIRDGMRQRIPGREVVQGDVLVLSEGDRVPADAVLRASAHVSADESLLTGESVPVRKVAADDTRALGRPGGEDLPFVFAGTLITRGQGLAEVRATGPRTEMGRIGKALATVEPGRSALQRETARLVRRLLMVAVALCVIVIVAYGLRRADWLSGFLAGLTLAMAILPNEFPAVLAIFLALGAWRISQKNVLTRRIPALEALGSATVLCVDKTGTLTQNRMSVVTLASGAASYDVPPEDCTIPETFHDVLEYGILASQRDPFDPMEKAFQDLGALRLAGTEHLHPNWTLVRQYPLSERLLAISHVWRSPDGLDYVIAAKGAPEAIADLCHLDAASIEDVRAQVATLATDGLRVLGVARAQFRPGTLPLEQHDFDFEWVGLAGLADPLRPAVPDAIRECHAAGIRVVMITGDHPQTARAIARQIGLYNEDGVLTGPELDALDDASLRARVRSVDIFARVVPEQKLRLVQALQAGGEVVAMTGDGVNDAPALKAADIGVAMGGHGTDVARESAALVLLDDDFSSIVAAIRLGRRVFDNLKNAMAYVLAVHVPIAGISMVPALLGLPLVLLPVHVALLHMIIEPACSVVFEMEPEDAGVMRRPPRDPREALFSRSLMGLSLLQGVSVLLIMSAVFLGTLWRGKDEGEARALTFTALIVANLALILTNRSWSRTMWDTLGQPNRALWWVMGSALGMLGLVLYVPTLRQAFRMAPLHANDLSLCLGAGMVGVAWFETLKVIRRRRGALAAAETIRGGVLSRPPPRHRSVPGSR